jgi:hypothetical protein
VPLGTQMIDDGGASDAVTVASDLADEARYLRDMARLLVVRRNALLAATLAGDACSAGAHQIL